MHRAPKVGATADVFTAGRCASAVPSLFHANLHVSQIDQFRFPRLKIISKMQGFLQWVYPLSILYNYFLLIWSENSVFTSVCQINLLRDEEQRLIKGLSRYIEATKRNSEVVPEEVVR